MPRVATGPFHGSDDQRRVTWTAQMLDASEATAKMIGCSPQAVVAQAALETGWGKAAIGHNIFGIKADASWKGDKQLVTTHEFVDGKWVTVQAWFRDYPSFADSIADHFRFLKVNKNYANMFAPGAIKSDADYFRLLQQDGYATDPNYADTLLKVLASVKALEARMTVS